MDQDRITPRKLVRGAVRRIRVFSRKSHDLFSGSVIRLTRAWPCPKSQVLVVGCESSGTTVMAKLLFGSSEGRFLVEGHERWVWRAYMSVYQGSSSIEEYPKLQLFDHVKVPGFAAILTHYRRAFPAARVLYVVRDPRDVLASAIRTFKLQTRDQLAEVSWVKQDWLRIAATDPVERLATRWVRYLEESQKISDVTYVRYEDFCDDKLDTTRRLCQALSLPFDHGTAMTIADRQASHHSVRAYTPTGPGHWRDCPHILDGDEERIRAICGDQLARWGYV